MSADQNEGIPLLTLDQVRDPLCPNIYWVSRLSEAVVGKILDDYLGSGKPFGIEVGFGYEISRVGLIDGSLDWLVFSGELRDYQMAPTRISTLSKINKEELGGYRLGVDCRILAFCEEIYPQTIRQAKVIVFRNPDHLFMRVMIPKFDDLKIGQRLVLVVNGNYTRQYDYYVETLRLRGYDPELLRVRHPEQPPLSYYRPGDDPGYVFDFTK